MPTRGKAAAKSSAAGAGSATAGADEESAPPPTQWAMLIKDFYTARGFVDDTPAAAALHTDQRSPMTPKASICSLATGGSMRSSSSGPMPSTPLRTTGAGFSHRHQSMHGSLIL